MHFASVRYLDVDGGRILHVKVNDGETIQLAAINRTASGDQAKDSLLLYFEVLLNKGENVITLFFNNTI